jgi:hypothetical protein
LTTKPKPLVNYFLAAPADVDPALRFEKWENLDLISKTRLLNFLQAPPLKRQRQDCDLLAGLLRGEEFEQIRSSPRGMSALCMLASYVARHSRGENM